MVTSSEQAKKIQTRRVQSGKRGFAKAVRRYYKERASFHLYPTFYRESLDSLPHRF